jgi:predicted HicB family RNase H-like nuclease
MLSCIQETLIGMIPMAKTSEDKIQTTIYLPKNVHTELRIKALKEHVSMTKLIVRAILRELQTAVEHKESKN